ncbi:MAG TPA: hypothetical protein VG603_10525, partial [Chitinophagales bacterium]|nr:hypothetical protein [Chitinophagales bacterium]
RFDKTELDAVVFWMGYTLEMNYFIETGRFAEAYQKISNIKAGIKTFSPNIAKQNRMMLQCIMAYVSFAMAKYHETLDHLAPVIQEQEKSLAAEVQLVARIMQLLSHFENGNKLLLESLVKSLQRSLRAKNEAAKVPMAIVSFINSSIRKPALQKQDWQQLQSKLKRLSANKPPQGISDLIDYKTWIKAHIKGVSFAEARRSVPSPH